MRTNAKILKGTFYKYGFGGRFYERHYQLTWMDDKLCYGNPDKTDLSGSLPLADVQDMTIILANENNKLDSVGIVEYKSKNIFASKETVKVAGVITLTIKGVEYGLAVSTPDDFYTLAYFLIASVEKHTKYKFKVSDDDMDNLEKVDKDNWKEMTSWKGGSWHSKRAALLFRRMHEEFREIEDYKNKNNDEMKSSIKITQPTKKIGEGANGMVFDFKNEKWGNATKKQMYGDEPVVVKFMRAVGTDNKHSKELAKKARKEVEALLVAHNGGAHNNINRIIDIESNEVGYWIFLEWCDTESVPWFKKHLNLTEIGKKATENAEAYVVGVLSGFSRMHERGIVHLDQKYQNLMFCGNVVKILDLGEAMGPGLTNVNKSKSTWDVEFTGSPLWLTPDQVTQSNKELTFDQMKLIDSFKVGMLLIRALARAFLSRDIFPKIDVSVWSKIADGELLVYKKNDEAPTISGLVERVLSGEITAMEFILGNHYGADALSWKAAIEAFGASEAGKKHPYNGLFDICNALLPLIEIDPSKRKTVLEMKKELVKYGKLKIESELSKKLKKLNNEGDEKF